MAEILNGTVCFKSALFDCGTQLGLSVQLTDGTRMAARMSPTSTPAEVATALRGLANWCESKSTELPEDTRS